MTDLGEAGTDLRICLAKSHGMLCDRQADHRGDHVDIYGPLPGHTWSNETGRMSAPHVCEPPATPTAQDRGRTWVCPVCAGRWIPLEDRAGWRWRPVGSPEPISGEAIDRIARRLNHYHPNAAGGLYGQLLQDARDLLAEVERLRNLERVSAPASWTVAMKALRAAATDLVLVVGEERGGWAARWLLSRAWQIEENATGQRPGQLVAHRIQCAAFANGCMAEFAWYDHAVQVTDDGRRALELNGWRLDHGRWVCGQHPEPAP